MAAAGWCRKHDERQLRVGQSRAGVLAQEQNPKSRMRIYAVAN
jgi:hypothetical protein